MTWVKVCGLSRPEEVAAAVAAGADAVGFVSIEASPRFLPLGRVGDLADGVPDSVRCVLLTLDLTPPELLNAIATTRVDGVQPYGAHRSEASATAAANGLFVLEPVPAKHLAGYAGPDEGVIPLIDAAGQGAHGGTGQTFDWSLVGERDEDFVVAGGLGADNVGAVIRRVRPWGVDASSRLEGAPGVKDLGKVTAFVGEAKRA